MNRSLDLSLETDLAAALDRLVAGDLTGDDRRALLLKLDTIPDGWRRCAVTFLEDQAWRTALGQAPILKREKPLTSPIRHQRRPLVVVRYALAAGLLGLVALTLFRLSVQRSVPPDFFDVPDGKSIAAKVPTPAVPKLVSNPGLGQPIAWVGVVHPDDGESLPQSVPVLAATEANEEWLQAQPATIPEYVRAIWERRGYQIEENHRLVELGLQDGQPVGIPIDEVSLDYVGRQPL